MSSGGRDERPRGPKHLWAGDWRSESERARVARADPDAPTEQLDAAGGAEAARPAAEETRATDALPPRPGTRSARSAGPQSPRAAGARPAQGAGAPAGPGPATGPARGRPSPAPRRPRARRPSRRSVLAVSALLAVALVASVLAGRAVVGDDPPVRQPADSGSPARPAGGAGAVYAAASPAVVSVKAGSGQGTGFLIGRDGTIVTNSHVVGESDRVRVAFGRRGAAIDAEVLGSDVSTDLAVVRIPASSVPAGVRPLRFANSDAVRVGDRALAIGNPFGLDRTATEGIVSAVGRQIQAPNGFSIDSVIQTDAPINPGNSGGPLLNDSGRVIGVTSQIATAGSPGSVGVGFAVPSNTARDVIPRISRGSSVTRAYLGLETVSLSPAGRSGVVINAIVAGGPADRAGLLAGDIVTRVGGSEVSDAGDVSKAIARKRPGDEIAVDVERGLDRRVVRVTLGKRPERTP